jgi:hypothetical protein
MVDFGELREKAEKMAEEHSDQVDNAIDKAAGLLGGKFGHESQVAQGAEKLKDLIPGEGERPDDAKGKQPRKNPGKHAGARPGAGKREGANKPGGNAKPGGKRAR